MNGTADPAPPEEFSPLEPRRLSPRLASVAGPPSPSPASSSSSPPQLLAARSLAFDGSTPLPAGRDGHAEACTTLPSGGADFPFPPLGGASELSTPAAWFGAGGEARGRGDNAAGGGAGGGGGGGAPVEIIHANHTADAAAPSAALAGDAFPAFDGPAGTASEDVTIELHLGDEEEEEEEGGGGRRDLRPRHSGRCRRRGGGRRLRPPRGSVAR